MARFANRREFIKIVAGATATVSLPFALRAAKAGATGDGKRPNIVLMMADDMGYSDLGCYGGEIQTPNVNSLAQRGLRFTHFYNNAKCVPTRASLLTGLYSQQSGEGRYRNCVTIAEALKAAGYRTLMVGKWHTSAGSIPTERGFDRSYGLVAGCCNYFNPGEQRPGEPAPGRKVVDGVIKWAIDDKVFRPYTPEDRKFYTTDAFTDNALKYLDQYGRATEPFFLYVAFNAPHYPLHAWPEDVAKYRGKYMDGPDPVRKARLERQLAMGIIEKQWALSPRDDRSPDWSTLDAARKDDEDLRMSIYAAQIDRVDQNVGRILAKIKELGIEENTLIMFLSDNGATSEGGPFGFNMVEGVKPGGLDSYASYGLIWGNASNTPFRKYKSYNHEGGISTPLIARWPGVIKPNTMTREVGHLIDVMPTLLDVAGGKYPTTFKNETIPPMQGKSLVPVLKGGTLGDRGPLFWQHSSEKAMREGKWKIVAMGQAPWELYDMEADRTELRDLAKQDSERVTRMAAMWDEWAKCVGAHDPAKGSDKHRGRKQSKDAGGKTNPPAPSRTGDKKNDGSNKKSDK